MVFKRDLDEKIVKYLTQDKGTIGAQLKASIKEILHRSPHITCEIRPKNEIHIYDGPARIAIKLNGLKNTPPYIQFDINNEYFDNIENDITIRETLKFFNNVPYQDSYKNIVKHVRKAFRKAKVHSKANGAEGMIEGIFVKQCRLFPKHFYPIDRQFKHPNHPGSRIDVVGIHEDSKLIYFEIKLNGDNRSDTEFNQQLIKYNELIKDTDAQIEIAESYKIAYEQRYKYLGEESYKNFIEEKNINWEKIKTSPPKLILLLAGYSEEEVNHFIKIADGKYEIQSFLLNTVK